LKYTSSLTGWRDRSGSPVHEDWVSKLRWHVIGILIGVALVASQAKPGAAPVGSNGCDLSVNDASWVQRALDGWELVRRDFLQLPPGALPWIVLFDASCQWHLNPPDLRLLPESRSLTPSPLTFHGSGVDVQALAHSGTVLLPNRVEIPIEVKAATALYRNGRMTFLVMAMPSVWRANRQHAKNPHLDEYLLGAFTHEMTHTRQLVPINRRLRQLIGSADMPDRLTDDVIQERFQKEPGFTRLVERERDLLFRAAGLTDPALRRQTASQALAMISDRRARYYSGRNTPYAEIESLFLTMEGVGQWAAYKLIEARGALGMKDAGRGPAPVSTARGSSRADAALDPLRLVRDNRRYWSQDQGLALFLLLDLLVPDWQARIFQPVPASPLILLEDALGKYPHSP
jgi:hypothetical protein